ncbi:MULTISPECIES: I78 family peptidase inhibitor [unclassified Pseudomonas]|uniref:I78 family peptidase inhibitor n=1 Tax=unclassified Pseudomonas TaxID=196821 RepID=UPI00119AD9EA|nr:MULTISPECIES: I78 family peptidase inhibitor [unclassified Pseudomonas]TWC16685.1 peptidase inhibitor I78 family protein [Pseudomonas sp. SJZ074]TWC17984.1 peptidase inhibitor I78 family protein [Pseudomonas sp. SJZ075]TWC34260.1 peptidase inhibitor I78 family protein [Pseudomonas sp. SJZ078]TWC34857.1 peptidase inhibitor I78 family protein [Pseudomonas sp. SJZ085]TWC55149.1 peptidase inhibitor I78 family protein [Pseudomonas sp. SJZ124]
MISKSLVLTSILLLGATANAQAACDAAAVKHLVNTMETPSLTSEATQASGAVSVLLVRPGGVDIKFKNPDRLKIFIDDTGKITDVRCE